MARRAKNGINKITINEASENVMISQDCCINEIPGSLQMHQCGSSQISPVYMRLGFALTGAWLSVNLTQGDGIIDQHLKIDLFKCTQLPKQMVCP